jgi:hypothetical protein
MDKKIKELKNYSLEPDQHVWERLNNRLIQDRQVKRINRFKVISIAASFVAIFSCSIVLIQFLGDGSKNSMADLIDAVPSSMEELSSDSNTLYNLSNIQLLNSAYHIGQE